MTFPNSLVIMPAAEHSHTIILLHGRGSYAEEFADEFLEEIQIKPPGDSLRQHYKASGIKWIFPTAHKRWSTVFREEQSEWFDIYSLFNSNSEECLQVQGLGESIQHVRDIISQEVDGAGIQAQNIFLGGISQGYATAIHVLLSGHLQLGGFVGISGWLPFQPHLSTFASADAKDISALLKRFYAQILQVPAKTTTAALQTPIFLSHSQNDDIVEIEHGRLARDTLQKLGLQIVQWHEHEDGDHWLADKGYHDLKEFLDSNLRNY